MHRYAIASLLCAFALQAQTTRHIDIEMPRCPNVGSEIDLIFDGDEARPVPATKVRSDLWRGNVRKTVDARKKHSASVRYGGGRTVCAKSKEPVPRTGDEYRWAMRFVFPCLHDQVWSSLKVSTTRYPTHYVRYLPAEEPDTTDCEDGNEIRRGPVELQSVAASEWIFLHFGHADVAYPYYHLLIDPQVVGSGVLTVDRAAVGVNWGLRGRNGPNDVHISKIRLPKDFKVRLTKVD